MPNALRSDGAFLGTFNTPDAFHVATLTPGQAGQLGQTFNIGVNTYTLVQLDTSSTTPAVGQLFFWRDKALNIVTNVVARAINGATTHGWRNEPAGILRVAATAGDYVFLLTQGAAIPCACLATNAVGDIAIADLSANVGYVLNIAAGSSITYRTVGVFRAISSGNLATVDVAIPTLG